MTVKELINNLQEYPDNANVILSVTSYCDDEEYQNDYDIIDTCPFRHDRHGKVKDVLLVELER